MIVQEREDVLRMDVHGEADLFRRYVERFWTRRPVAQEFLDTAQKNECMQDISFRMEIENRADWDLGELADYVNRRRPDLATPDDWMRYLLDIRVYSFLDASAGGETGQAFAFSHEAFREYFLAEYLVARLLKGNLEPFREVRLSQEVARMMAGLLALMPASSVVDLSVLPRLAASQVRRNLALLEIVRYRRCPTWPLESVDFSGLDLSGTDFSNCKLEGAGFIACGLLNARFDGATLDKAKFEGSRIAGASFHNTRVTAAQFRNCDTVPPGLVR
jgi:hypothetical protein